MALNIIDLNSARLERASRRNQDSGAAEILRCQMIVSMCESVRAVMDECAEKLADPVMKRFSSDRSICEDTMSKMIEDFNYFDEILRHHQLLMGLRASILKNRK